MQIDISNVQDGNKAMASVLLLYYHLLEEGGITNDQTVYIDPDDFNGFSFLEVSVKEAENECLDINELLLREGAIIYLVCELNDIIGEFESDFHSHQRTKDLITSLSRNTSEPIPEIKTLLEHVKVVESEFDFNAYQRVLKDIYRKYVHGFFASKLE